MKRVIIACGLVAMLAGSATAGIGDWWVLPIDRLDGSFTTYAGAGYDGTDAKEGSGMDGSRRVWWNTANVYASSGAAFPAAVEDYTIEAYLATEGELNWQPVQVQLNGYHGAINFPMEPEIPWAGKYGTNHEWLGSEGPGAGTWKALGAGPHAHPDAEDGVSMYMKAGSVLYAKWDYTWPITRSWSMLRVTQITPEPASLLLLALGGLLLRRKAA